MRLGTSGFGVIAVVSLLVTAAPERDDSGGNNRGSSIDQSRSNGSKRTSGTLYSWPSQVATETSSSRSSSFIKIEFESRGSTSPENSRRLSHPSLVPPLHHINRKAEIPTALWGFTTNIPASRRPLVQPRNFENSAIPPDDRFTNSSLKTTLENNESLEMDSSIPVSGAPSRDFEEKLVFTLDSPLFTSIVSDPTLLSSPLRRRRGKRETTSQSRRSETQDNYGDKRSTTNLNETTTGNSNGSPTAKSARTMNHLLTTTTTTTTTTNTNTRRRLLDENFRNATEHYEVKTIRGSREFSRNKETTESSNGQPYFRNNEGEPNALLKLNGRTMSREANDALHSESRYLTNYSIHLRPTIYFEMQDGGSDEGMKTGQDEPAAKRLIADRTIVKPENTSPDEFVLIGKSLRKMETAFSEDSLIRDDGIVEQQGLTVKSMVDIIARKPETLGYSTVTEEIDRARQITSEPSQEISTIERPLLKSPGNIANTNGAATSASLDNYEAVRFRSFQTVRIEQQQQQRAVSLETPTLPSRLPYEIDVKDTVDTKDVITSTEIERPAIPVNRLMIPKSAYPVVKNLSKPSINLVDGKGKKKYYEIKPSLITEMDHGMNLEVTTTPRRTFDKFLLPSVPSAFGKFGPYFLDEDDRRNVTERIGNTVQLDCRIGLLGHRKVTWLQHYKDSFRLLTVERESYSVDRRISLNFQYPDNWRLQIAYASLRDSGLYKCQVEIDEDRSLVKRYNVIITAPVLTITDDSGRPISGERHLKAGSALKLRCEARDVIQRLNESVLWMRGDETLTEDVSENRTTEVGNEKEISVVFSILLIERATPRHAGNYSCVVPEKVRTTIAVHVLNGELPAAVQHGSGVSTAVLNLWLIHLTASYGFFR